MKVYIVEWSNEFSDAHRLVGAFSTFAQAKAQIPDGRWRIYEAEVDGRPPSIVEIAPGWGED